MKATLIELAQRLRERLNGVGEWLAPLGRRVTLAWEFWESGMEKFHGQNWFAELPWASWQVGFPWPFTIGRASGRERVCQYVKICVVAGTLKKKHHPQSADTSSNTI